MSDCDDRSAAPAPKGRLAKYMRTERRRHGSDRMRDAVLALLTQGESSLCEVVKPLHRHMERYAATGRPQDALLSATTIHGSYLDLGLEPRSHTTA